MFYIRLKSNTRVQTKVRTTSLQTKVRTTSLQTKVRTTRLHGYLAYLHTGNYILGKNSGCTFESNIGAETSARLSTWFCLAKNKPTKSKIVIVINLIRA
jgi:hypothetical protein